MAKARAGRVQLAVWVASACMVALKAKSLETGLPIREIIEKAVADWKPAAPMEPTDVRSDIDDLRDRVGKLEALIQAGDGAAMLANGEVEAEVPASAPGTALVEVPASVSDFDDLLTAPRRVSVLDEMIEKYLPSPPDATELELVAQLEELFCGTPQDLSREDTQKLRRAIDEKSAAIADRYNIPYPAGEPLGPLSLLGALTKRRAKPYAPIHASIEDAFVKLAAIQPKPAPSPVIKAPLTGIEAVIEELASAGLGQSAIARELGGRGFTTSTGKPIGKSDRRIVYAVKAAKASAADGL